MHLHNNTTQQYPDIPVHKQTQYPDTICTHTNTENNTEHSGHRPDTEHSTEQNTALAQPQHRTTHLHTTQNSTQRTEHKIQQYAVHTIILHIVLIFITYNNV